MSIEKKSSAAIVLPQYTVGEEIANSVIHGVGVLAAIAGLVLLTLKTGGVLGGPRADNIDIAAVVLFTATMISMFLISTLYHAVQHQEAKRILRKFDHSVIFIFIAGTYTPFCLIGLKGAWGWSILAVEWSLALFGIFLNIINNKALKKVEVAAYIAMGWAIVVGCVPLVRAIPIQSIILLLAGGVAYSLGTIWYRKKTVRLTHVVWHGFVLLGTVCHWLSVWYFI